MAPVFLFPAIDSAEVVLIYLLRTGVLGIGLVSRLGRIAQLGERFPYKEDVTGSSPVSPTTSLDQPDQSCRLMGV